MSALFSDSLTLPSKNPIHPDGRKRIDIFYVNGGTGFFGWVGANYPAASVVVGPQGLRGIPRTGTRSARAGSPRVKGSSGSSVPRFKNKRIGSRSCRDTAKEDRGLIIALDNDDLGELVALAAANDYPGIYRVPPSRSAFSTSSQEGHCPESTCPRIDARRRVKAKRTP